MEKKGSFLVFFWHLDVVWSSPVHHSNTLGLRHFYWVFRMALRVFSGIFNPFFYSSNILLLQFSFAGKEQTINFQGAEKKLKTGLYVKGALNLLGFSVVTEIQISTQVNEFDNLRAGFRMSAWETRRQIPNCTIAVYYILP